MAVEHKNIPEDGLHEPKGASTASGDTTYVSDGAGSGSWKKVDANTLQGLVNNTTVAGQRIVTDGSGGFTAEATPASSFGSMNLTNNATTKALSAATDTTLNNNSDYVAFDLALNFDAIQNMGTGSNYLEVNQSGLYLIDFWGSVKSNVNTTKFALKFSVNGVDFVPREVKHTLSSAGVIYNISGNGIHQFESGDQISLYIAADKACNITIEDMTFRTVYLGTF